MLMERSNAVDARAAMAQLRGYLTDLHEILSSAAGQDFDLSAERREG
jgi:hypothetical protein